MTMVPSMTIVTCAISACISLCLPVVLLAVFAVKNKKQGIISAWLLGAAGFFVTQILIRVPILTVLQTQSRFVEFANSHIFAYTFTLAFTAGLFELAGRFGVAKILEKKLTWKRTLAAGLGHGGIEAMILVGMTYLNNILYIFMINSGTFDAVVSEAVAAGVDVSALLMVKDQLFSSTPALFLLGGFERILAMIGHLGMCMIVCYGVYTDKPLKGALICLGIHTLMDLTAGISMLIGKGLSQTAAYVIIYAILTVMAVLSVLIIRKIRRSWRETEE